MKTPIVIHLWDGVSSGYTWLPATPENIEELRADFEVDLRYPEYTHVALVEINVAGYSTDTADRTAISEYIEGELQDALTLGSIGKIHAIHRAEDAS